jgi:molybdopterin-binding protein
MTLSARNQLKGTVEELQLGGVMAHIVVRVGKNLIESVITRRSAEEMALKKGDIVKAVIKSTEVMLQKTENFCARNRFLAFCIAITSGAAQSIDSIHFTTSDFCTKSSNWCAVLRTLGHLLDIARFALLERETIDRIGMRFVGWNEVGAISNLQRGFDEPQRGWALD